LGNGTIVKDVIGRGQERWHHR